MVCLLLREKRGPIDYRRAGRSGQAMATQDAAFRKPHDGTGFLAVSHGRTILIDANIRPMLLARVDFRNAIRARRNLRVEK
jgi:hypothetical protein